MSLYGFFESYLEESPELLSVKAAPSEKYDDLFQFFKNKSKKLPADNFYDMLFNQSFTKYAKNLREYEILKLKSRKIGFLTQKQFNLISSNESEKNKIEKIEKIETPSKEN